jgi:ABC-type lipoprotein export system ATPase subunit
VTTTSSDLRVVRDKETGQLRAPTQSEALELLAAERASGKKAEQKVVVVTHPDGMKSAVLPESYMTTLHAVRDSEGNISFHHSDPALDSKPAVTATEK